MDVMEYNILQSCYYKSCLLKYFNKEIKQRIL